MTNSTPTTVDRAIAKYLAAAFQCTHPNVRRMWDDREQHSIDVLTASDSPARGTNALATIGLSAHTVHIEKQPLQFGVELLAVGFDPTDELRRMLASTAFDIFVSHHSVSPGTLLENAVARIDPCSPVPHAALADPFLWGDSFNSREFGTRTVAWLMFVPLTEAEFQFASKKGFELLSTRLQSARAEVANLQRASVV